MKRILSSVRAVDLRLVLAVAVCSLLFVATSTDEMDSCSSGHDGTITFENTSDWTIRVSISGPGGTRSTTIESRRLQYMYGVKPGYYAWKAVTIDSGMFHYSAAHFVTVVEKETVAVLIRLDD